MNTAKPLSPKNFPQLLTGLALISLSLVVSTAIAAKALLEVKKSNDVLIVTGSAKRPITSDYIVLGLSVSSQQPTAQAAYQDLKSQTERVQAYLKEKNVPTEAISLGAMETYAIPEITANGQETGETLAYRLTQRFEISGNDVERYSKLSQESTELINEGINLVVESPQYLYNELAPLRIEMVAEATKDAKARAEAIASNTNSKVGPVRSAQTGVFQITSRNSTDVSDTGTYDTSSIDKDITAVVSITFSMK